MAETTYIQLEHGCWQRVNERDHIVTTGFSDGAELHAKAMMDDESVAFARELGYAGSDRQAVWSMTVDHDRLHMELAQAEGLPWSPVLHGVATGRPVPCDVGTREECRVLYVQRKLNERRLEQRDSRDHPDERRKQDCEPRPDAVAGEQHDRDDEAGDR